MRGALWYQGEHNGWSPRGYATKTRALIGGWRKLWGEGEFPVYFVQLSGFQADWSRLREEQIKALAIPNTGMAVTIDIGNLTDVHPKNKQDVGLRLARWALAKTYGKAVAFSGPLYKGHKVEGNRVRIEFEYAESGLMVGAKNGVDPVRPVADGKLKRFQIAGANRVWKPAEAIIDGVTITVSSPEVSQPVAARYAFVPYPEGANLYNKDGLPASPFRTDDWP
jgi:sialate O-acetylesterase